MRQRGAGAGRGGRHVDRRGRPRPGDATEPAAAAAEEPGKRRVLIADDDRITRMLVRLLLERDGYEVLEGENGAQAVEIAHREHPDLLIIDLMMPEMDGYQAIEQHSPRRVAGDAAGDGADRRGRPRHRAARARDRRGRLHGQAVRGRRSCCRACGRRSAARSVRWLRKRCSGRPSVVPLDALRRDGGGPACIITA